MASNVSEIGSRPEGSAAVLADWAGRPGRAVMFDFNGTLSDDETILEAIFRDLFAEHLGWTMTPDHYRSHLLGRSDREIVEAGVTAHGNGDPELVETLLGLRATRYRAAVAERSPITPGATEFVRRLAAAAVPMAVVTGAQRADVLAVLDGNAGVRDLVTTIVTEEDVRRGKPDPEGYLRAAALLGVDPADVLVFEDSVPGMRSAASAGMQVIAVLGARPTPTVVEAAPAAVTRLDPALLDGSGI